MLKDAYEARQHAGPAVAMWMKINIFLVAPALAIAAYIIVPRELEHIEHMKQHPKEFIAFPYMRKRKNPFPWGDDNLFYCEFANP
ncbi:hypothetical protein HK104_006015, partial [Borealophlyctis nickersoniae]